MARLATDDLEEYDEGKDHHGAKTAGIARMRQPQRLCNALRAIVHGDVRGVDEVQENTVPVTEVWVASRNVAAGSRGAQGWAVAHIHQC